MPTRCVMTLITYWGLVGNEGIPCIGIIRESYSPLSTQNQHDNEEKARNTQNNDMKPMRRSRHCNINSTLGPQSVL